MGGMSSINNVNRGQSSYFNKNGSAHGNNKGLPNIGSSGGAGFGSNANRPSGLGQYGQP